MSFIRLMPVAAAAGMVLASQTAMGAIRSRLDCKNNTNGTKAISPETITDVGPPQNDPFAITRIVSARIRISDPVANALTVTKTMLTNEEAFGQGRPNGYTGGGPLNPSGPWQGLMWPYRDFNDGHAPATPPVARGNDVGTIVMTSPNTTVVDGIAGAMAVVPTTESSYLRGIPGNGATDYARFFSITLAFSDMSERDVIVTLESVEVDVLVRNRTTGQFSFDRQISPR